MDKKQKIYEKLELIQKLSNDFSNSARVINETVDEIKALLDDIIFVTISQDEISDELKSIDDSLTFEKNNSSFVTINGKHFRCKCAGNLFTKCDQVDFDIWKCNSCGEFYEGEK